MEARNLIGGSLSGSGESIIDAVAGRVGPSLRRTPFANFLIATSLIVPST